MSDPSELTSVRQNTAIWEGLEAFKHLPDWLVAARDPVMVKAALEKAIPEFRSGELHLLECDPGHFRFKSDFWTGLYKLTVSPLGMDQSQTVTLSAKVYSPNSNPDGAGVIEGKFGTDDFHVTIPSLHLDLHAEEPETILGALSMLTDANESLRFLTKSIQAGSPHYQGFQIQACHPKVVRYKPGSRCTIVYNLEYLPGQTGSEGWPDLVVAKTYRGEKGQNAYDSMTAIWNSPLGSSPSVTVAEPLAYEPGLRALIQGPIREDYTLKDLLERAIVANRSEDWEEAERMMTKTAIGLAELHQTGIHLGNVWTWEDELNEVLRWMVRLAKPLPDLAPAIDPLIGRLKELWKATAPDPVVPSHGSFRPAQVLIHQGKIGFIDFDSFCQSEPSLDLGLFLATVRNIGMITPFQMENREKDESLSVLYNRIDGLCETFLDQYQRMIPFSRNRLAIWETLDIFTYVIHSWTKIKTGESEETMLLLEKYLKDKSLVRGI